MIYDLVIIGAGPAGLTLAQCCSSINNKKILIIEKEEQIGGCHSVKRVNSYFSEHAPRIYSSAYINFMNILNDMGYNFYDLFVKYNISIKEINNQNISKIYTLRELSKFIYNLVILFINPKHGVDITIKDFMINNNFSNEAIDLTDRICRMVDGADINKFTLNEFLQIFNQQMIYSIYEPVKPNDENLFKIWYNYLKNKNVEFKLKTEIKELYNNYIITNDNQTIKFNKIIFAIPPYNLYKLLDNTTSNIKIKKSFGLIDNLNKWANNSKYIDYVSITFHWDKKIDIPQYLGLSTTDWGVISLIMSDYMTFKEEKSKTVISCAISILDRKSKNINKTANDVNDKDELIKEVFKQLKEYYKTLPEPTLSILSKNIYYENSKWHNDNSAYIAFNENFIPFQSKINTNFYNLGTHNGFHSYKFTSLESALTNAIKLATILYPELSAKYKIRKIMTLRDILIYFIIIVIIILLYFIIIK